MMVCRLGGYQKDEIKNPENFRSKHNGGLKIFKECKHWSSKGIPCKRIGHKIVWGVKQELS